MKDPVREQFLEVQRRIRAMDAILAWSHCSDELRRMVHDEAVVCQQWNTEVLAMLELRKRLYEQEFMAEIEA